MLPRSVLSLVCLSVLGSTFSSQAAPVLLDFQDLSNGLSVPSNYGSTTVLSVLFKVGDRPGNPGHPGQVASNFGTPGSFGVVELGNNSLQTLSEIFFTPDPGYEVSLVSFSRSRGTNTVNNAAFRLLDPNDAAVFSLDIENNPLEKVLVSVNSDFYTGPITFQYGSLSSGATRVDDILLEVRAIPEVSTIWLAGTGLIGLLGMHLRNRAKATRS